MARMLPWIRNWWETLTEEQKKEIAQYSRIICKAATIDSARAACLDRLEELCKKYPIFNDDCNRILKAKEAFADADIVPYSDIEFLINYFGQFSDLYPDGDWAVEETPGARKFLVHNDFHGDIVCTLVEETNSAYFFDYFKDGVEVFKGWRVLKRSGRVKEEIFA